MCFLVLAGLCHNGAEGINPTEPRPVGNQSNTAINRKSGGRPSTSSSGNKSVDRIRDVEAIDDGLLQGNVNFTETRVASGSNNNPLGKQFSNFPGSSFGGTDPTFNPGFGQSAGSFLPGQPGSIPLGLGFNGAFPNQGLLPGATLPPGAVNPDTVAFSAARASDFTRIGITQVRFDFTITDIGYGWYPDRSEFVCYYPGLYFFTFSGLSTQTRQIK